MAAYTSTQSGNWSDPATWGGSGTPGDGDTASIGAHTVTVDVATIVGTSPNDNTTNAIALASASSILNVAAGVTLTVKGNIGHVNGSTHRQQTGSTVTFDASASGGTPVYQFQNAGFSKFEVFGSSGAQAVIEAVSGRTASMSVPAGTVNLTHGTFRRITGLFKSTSASGNMIIRNCRFESCGVLNSLSTSTTLSCEIEGNVFESGTEANDLDVRWSNASASGVRSFSGNALGGSVNFVSVGFRFEGNYISGSISSTTTTVHATFRHNFIAGQLSNGQGMRIQAIAPVYRSYFFATTENPHFAAPVANGIDAIYSQCVFEQSRAAVSGTDAGDCISAAQTAATGGAKVIGRNNIVLRNASGGVSTGCLLTGYNLADGIATEWYRNTGNVEIAGSGVRRGMFAVAEASNGFAGQVAVLKSNLAWAVAASQGYLGERVQGNVKDIFTASGCDYNWRHNTSDGNNGRGYEARVASNTLWTAGDAAAAGVDANGGTGDPDFVDSTRNLATWTAARGYGSTNADGLAAIQADPSRTRDLIAYVFEGFKVANSLMRTAAHDGGVVGAANYHDSTRDTTRLGYHVATVGDTYGIAYTGDLPSTLVAPVLTVTAVGTISLSWTAATGGVEPYIYDVYRDGVLLAAGQTSPYVDSTATPGTTYTYVIRVTDDTGSTADSNEGTGYITPGPHRSRVWRVMQRQKSWKGR